MGPNAVASFGERTVSTVSLGVLNHLLYEGEVLGTVSEAPASSIIPLPDLHETEKCLQTRSHASSNEPQKQPRKVPSMDLYDCSDCKQVPFPGG